MIATIYDTDTGELLWTIDAPPEVIAAQTAGVRGWVEGEWDAALYYVVRDEPVSRPAIALSPEITAAAMADIPVPNAPLATEVRITDEDSGVIGPGMSLRFELPGVYRVEMRPPWPWQRLLCTVTVT